LPWHNEFVQQAFNNAPILLIKKSISARAELHHTPVDNNLAGCESRMVKLKQKKIRLYSLGAGHQNVLPFPQFLLNGTRERPACVGCSAMALFGDLFIPPCLLHSAASTA
jgi:hypothetical protein